MIQELVIRGTVAAVVVAFELAFTNWLSTTSVLGIAFIGLALCGPYYLLGRSGRWSRLQAYLRMLLDIVLITAGLYAAGGVDAAQYLSVYLIVPIYAGMVFSSAACVVATAAATGSYLVIAGLQMLGWLAPPAGAPGTATTVAFNLIVLNIAGGLTAILARALRRSRLRLKTIYQDLERFVETIPDIIYVVDVAGGLTRWNQRLEAVTGRTAASLQGVPFLDVFAEDGREAIAGALRLGLEGGRFEVEARLRGVNGEPIAYHWTGAAIQGEQGDVVAVAGVGRDVTERNQAAEALRQRENELRQLQKIEAVGRLAGGVAHDFNNLLTVIIGRSQLLLRRLTAADTGRTDVELIEATAERAASLTRQLLAFSRKQALEPKVLSLNTVVTGIMGMLRRLIGEHIELVTTLDDGLGHVRADHAQIEQILLNLVVNARDAIHGTGRVTVTTRNVVVDDRFVRTHPGSSAGPHVALVVSDTGAGMDETTQQRVFEPFFTTKEPGRGTGLGLSTVYGIVKQHGGYIMVESRPGAGATFTIYLPRTDEPVEAARAPEPGAARGGDETILLVEDEDEVRDVTATILRKYGYRVLTAANGDGALTVSGSHAGPIHLLLTDIVMPGMSGPQLSDLLETMRPGVRVLYMSGYADQIAGLDGLLLPKPFLPEILARRVRESLASRPTESATAAPAHRG